MQPLVFLPPDNGKVNSADYGDRSIVLFLNVLVEKQVELQEKIRHLGRESPFRKFLEDLEAETTHIIYTILIQLPCLFVINYLNNVKQRVGTSECTITAGHVLNSILYPATFCNITTPDRLEVWKKGKCFNGLDEGTEGEEEENFAVLLQVHTESYEKCQSRKKNEELVADLKAKFHEKPSQPTKYRESLRNSSPVPLQAEKPPQKFIPNQNQRMAKGNK